MRHETREIPPPAMLATIRAGSRHWSALRLPSFTAPEALSFARNLERTQPDAPAMLRACEDGLKVLRASGAEVQPTPMLVLDEDAEPAILLPLVRRRHDGLLEILPLPLKARGLHAEATASVAQAAPLCRPGLNLTRQEADAIRHVLLRKMPPADIVRLALCPPDGHEPDHHLPPAHALSWRGMYHLLRHRLALGG